MIPASAQYCPKKFTVTPIISHFQHITLQQYVNANGTLQKSVDANGTLQQYVNSNGTLQRSVNVNGTLQFAAYVCNLTKEVEYEQGYVRSQIYTVLHEQDDKGRRLFLVSNKYF